MIVFKDFHNFFTNFIVFEVGKSIADTPTELPCSSQIECGWKA